MSILILLIPFCSCLNHKIKSEKREPSTQIPIITFGGVPPAKSSIVRYKELRYSGITYSISSFPDTTEMQKALQLARKTGIKMIISWPMLKADPKKAVKLAMNNPSVAGYYIRDEPGSYDFKNLKQLVTEIHSVDSIYFCYINLLPNYATKGQLGAESYEKYVDSFIKEVPIKFISFDNYPIIRNSVRKKWYKNLEVISRESRKAGKQFWAFALTTSHFSYPIPTLSDLRLEVFSDLAYGAQGIEYFYYWTEETSTVNYHHGPITQKGKRSEVYDRMKEVNEEVKNLSWVFKDAKVVSISQTGDTIPVGTTRLTSLPNHIRELKTKGKGAVTSVLKNKEDTFFVIVNRDFKNSMKLAIHCDSIVKKVLKDGSVVPASAYMNTLEIAPGDMAIYMWGNNKNEK